ncbi:MAG: tetratricopeptide repeat protein [bacterium]|nr:tetratricopeptide repeat protein [bacterium]
MSDPALPLPSLTLPVALLRFWPDESDDRRARGIAAKLFDLPGVTQLDERLFAILPTNGRASVFDTAVLLAAAFFERLDSQHAGEEISGVLVLPAEVIQHGEAVVLVRDALVEDLDRRRPRLPQGEIVTTGYAAGWLDGRYEMEKLDLYAGPSGRRIPMFGLRGRKSESLPWHNPKLLGRRVMVKRPEIEAALAAIAPQGGISVTGPLGAGKTHAVWHALESRKGTKIWTGIGRALYGTDVLGHNLANRLQQLAPDAIPASAADLLRDAPLDQAAETLLDWLAATVDKLDHPPWIVCDLVQTASAGDMELLDHLVAGPLPCGLILISRGGMESEAFGSLPRIEVPAMDEAEGVEHARELIEGLSIDADIETRWVTAAAGFPFALEEGLVGLVHRGLIRQVYGSFFYDGSDDVEYKPSQRLVRHVEAEVRRFGEPLPLRILALAGQTITPGHLEITCARFGIQMTPDWHRDALASGMLRRAESPWGTGLVFRCPAYARALAGTVTFEAASSLRRALGRVITKEPESPEKGWATYRLLAGTPEALPPLLDLSRDSGSQATRDELFEALRNEYQQHRRRSGDPAAELDILWSMLPLGRRLGKLGELESDLLRAISLAFDSPKRHIALLTLKAELDQERGRFREAEKSLRQALGASSEASDDRQRATLFIRLGDLLKRMDRLGESREVFESLLEVVDRQTDTSVGATCHFHLGNIALREMRLEDAMLHHKKAETVRREKKLFKPLGTSLTALGAVAMAIGDFSKALGYYREALKVISEYGDDADESGFAHLGSGRALGSLGNHTAATKLLRRALAARSGRDDVVGEAIARLDLAANQLELGNTAKALQEARQAHFQLSLLPETALLGDAEQLLGRILMRQRQEVEARLQLAEALRIHRQHGDRTAAAIDSAWLLELALERNDKEAIVNYSTALEKLLKQLPYPPAGEMLQFRLFRAFNWLCENEEDIEGRDPLTYLRRAYRELMRKTGFLSPELRHGFLYQIQEHQEVINAAAENNLSLPGL